MGGCFSPGFTHSDICAMTSVEHRARLVLGNWKMHGNLAENAALLTELRAADAASHCEIGVCVPFPYLAQAASALTGSAVSWGAQANLRLPESTTPRFFSSCHFPLTVPRSRKSYWLQTSTLNCFPASGESLFSMI